MVLDTQKVMQPFELISTNAADLKELKYCMTCFQVRTNFGDLKYIYYFQSLKKMYFQKDKILVFPISVYNILTIKLFK
jgi:hypothetical protein